MIYGLIFSSFPGKCNMGWTEMTIFISPEIIFQMGIYSNYISMNWQFDLKKNNVTNTNSFYLNHYLINDD